MIERLDLTRLERTLGFKMPEQIRSRDWGHWLMPVLLALLIGLNIRGLAFEDDLSRVWRVANILWMSLLVIVLVGEGLYAGIYWRTSEGVARFGRGLRIVVMLLVMILFPPFCATWGISVSENSSYDWRFGGLVGAGAGVVILLALIFYLRRRYRNLGSSD